MKKYTKTKLKKLGANKVRKIAEELGIKIKKPTLDKLIPLILEKQDTGHQKKTVPQQKIIFSEQISHKTYSHENKLSINKYFIQINKNNLLGYISSALIHPVNYETRDMARNERQKDIQNLTPDYLLITDGFADVQNKEQILLEVILIESDKKHLKVLDDKVCLLSYPLPISRIKCMYIANDDAKANIASIFKTYKDAELPDNLIKRWTNNFTDNSKIVSKLDTSNISESNKLKIKEKEHFDRVLGMISYMKNANLYFTDLSGNYANFSKYCLKVVNLINPHIQSKDINIRFNSNDPLKDYFEALINGEAKRQTLDDILHKIYQNTSIQKNDLQEILSPHVRDINIKSAFESLLDDRTKDCLEELSTKQPEFTLLAMLYRFRNKSGGDKTALKKQLQEQMLLDYEKIEQQKNGKMSQRVNFILAGLGLYYGYRSLPKHEEISLNDSFYSSIERYIKVKFNPNSFIDRMIIESVYQFCFNGKVDSEFDFLPKQSIKPTFVQVPKNYEDNSFELYGEIVRRFSKLKTKRVSIMDIFKTWFSKLLFGTNVDYIERKDGSSVINLPDGSTIEYKPNQKHK